MSTIGSGKSDLGTTVDFSSDQMKSAADWLGAAWHRGERYGTGGLKERVSASRTINPLLTSQVPDGVDQTSKLPTLREIMARVHDTAKRKQSLEENKTKVLRPRWKRQPQPVALILQPSPGHEH